MISCRMIKWRIMLVNKLLLGSIILFLSVIYLSLKVSNNGLIPWNKNQPLQISVRDKIENNIVSEAAKRNLEVIELYKKVLESKHYTVRNPDDKFYGERNSDTNNHMVVNSSSRKELTRGKVDNKDNRIKLIKLHSDPLSINKEKNKTALFVSTMKANKKTSTKMSKEITDGENMLEKNYYRKYSYDDPTSYKGPIIKAWPPSKSRNVVIYTKEPFTRLPRIEKMANKTLLVIVTSNPSDVDLRNIWRNSWGKYANSQTLVLFLIGKTLSDGVTRSKLLQEESKYDDVVQVDGLIEHYDNLTLKSLYALKFFLDKDNLFSSQNQFQYLLKVDTDTIVNLPRLYHQLTTDEKYKNVKNLLMGCCFCCVGTSKLQCRVQKVNEGNNQFIKGRKAKVIIKHNKEKDFDLWKKWQVPNYMYNQKKYPSYLSGGGGYVLSRSSADCMFKKSLDIPYFHMEDVYLTGFVAQACKITRLDNPGFHGTRKKYFDYETDIVIHQSCSSSDPSYKAKCYGRLEYISAKYAILLDNENKESLVSR